MGILVVWVDYRRLFAVVVAFAVVAHRTSQRKVGPLHDKIGPLALGEYVLDVAEGDVPHLALTERTLFRSLGDDCGFDVGVSMPTELMASAAFSQLQIFLRPRLGVVAKHLWRLSLS